MMTFATSTRVDEFLESIKKGSAYRSDHQQKNRCYIRSVAPQWATGICTPDYCMATPDAPSVFFCVDATAYPFNTAQIRTVSMVALVGLLSSRPESIQSGSANPANVTANHDICTSGGDSYNCMEAAKWLLPLPKNRHLSRLSPLFAAICRQLKPKSITSPQSLSRKPAVHWFGITSAFSLVVSVWRWLMRNYFRITGYAVNKRGLAMEVTA